MSYISAIASALDDQQVTYTLGGESGSEQESIIVHPVSAGAAPVVVMRIGAYGRTVADETMSVWAVSSMGYTDEDRWTFTFDSGVPGKVVAAVVTQIVASANQ